MTWEDDLQQAANLAHASANRVGLHTTYGQELLKLGTRLRADGRGRALRDCRAALQRMVQAVRDQAERLHDAGVACPPPRPDGGAPLTPEEWLLLGQWLFGTTPTTYAAPGDGRNPSAPAK